LLKRIALLVGALVVGAGWITAVLLWIAARVAAPAPSPMGEPPADLRAEAIEFVGGGATRLSGWWIPGHSRGGAVVLAHALGGSRTDMLARARALRTLGVSTLLYDQRAHGTSGGDRITFGALESEDARAAVLFARERLPGERVGALGIGLGGAALLIGAQVGTLDALVVESTPPTLRDAVRRRLRAQIGSLAELLLPWVAARVTPGLGASPDRLAALQAASRFGRPLLVVAGENDPAVPAAETKELFDAASEPKSIWIVPGAGGSDLVARNPSEYKRRVIDFLADAVRTPADLDSRAAVAPALESEAIPEPTYEDPGRATDLD